MHRFLIVNADDFGLSDAVNRGIVEAHQNGIVTSTTIMANMPGFDNAVSLANELPDLGIGFHFNLTYGAPLLPPEEIPSLVDDQGNFRPISRETIENWKTEDIAKELAAQWEKVKASGIKITHLDSHHYIQIMPSVRSLFLELAKKENLPTRHTFTLNFQEMNMPLVSKRSELPPSHPATTEFFIGDIYFQEDRLNKLLGHLENLSEGLTELNCHPGYIDDDLKRLSALTDYRVTELQTLTHPEVKKRVQELGIQLVHFGTARLS
ncbi:carbohydrate deacetylase [Thermoactinomyces sp. CICC 10523]|uniref:carbohydrate deacetylase n=1 Tax=Thermoactinomyces sp. CICC 10523 TaxID=2767428 RepID=UPI0018DB17C6|nr:carbohydrate deacetylase [Thermoactinomyces sp. CICC 10523]MBH8599208.1 carbohydrate deacetylase [Thermoactinomyces sp. CICC 10523]